MPPDPLPRSQKRDGRKLSLGLLAFRIAFTALMMFYIWWWFLVPHFAKRVWQLPKPSELVWVDGEFGRINGKGPLRFDMAGGGSLNLYCRPYLTKFNECLGSSYLNSRAKIAYYVVNDVYGKEAILVSVLVGAQYRMTIPAALSRLRSAAKTEDEDQRSPLDLIIACVVALVSLTIWRDFSPKVPVYAGTMLSE